MSGNVNVYLDMVPLANSGQPNYMAMLAAVLQAWADTRAVEVAAPQYYDLDAAVGAQLDVVGNWIGVSRNLPAAIVGVYFALDTPGVGFDQGVWQGPYDPSTGLVSLPDDYYRAVLKARILNNHWDGSKPGAYALGSVILTSLGYQLFIVDRSDLTMDLGIFGSNAPTALLQALFQQGIINVKPAGIHISNYIFQTAPGPIFALDMNNSYFAGFDQGSWATIITN